MYGQYDNNFVTLNFHHNSEAYRSFKPTLMGSFFYTLDERQKLQALIATENIPRTNQYIKFKPSTLEELSADQIEALDRHGILNADIDVVYSANRPRYNRFILKGEKDIPNTIEVKFDSSGMDLDRFRMGFFGSRIRNGYKLIPEEEFEYFGLQLFYNPDFKIEEHKEKILDGATGKIKEPIRYYQLKAKFLKSELVGEESKEFQDIISRRSELKIAILTDELNRSTEKLKDIAVQHKDALKSLIYICSQFESEVLLPYEIPIWWDFERFLHIYVRHVKETKVGERYAEKTIFQYKFKDVSRIVKAVIESVYTEIKEHFLQNPTANFRRIGA
ncbi:MAG TPA: hypothetical protein VE978_13300 [Chitinophagales bacterium]|nr:hypothetical protein [Chitinophagales bacterium]